jgi:XTP/dITP diphosphohydrolase
VYSARYAGADADDAANRAKLLRAMDGRNQRAAAFHCVLALVRSATDPLPILAQGHWPGEIMNAERGSGGFGYDPVFFDPALGLTAAEMDPESKQARSHRGHAVRQLLEQLRAA